MSTKNTGKAEKKVSAYQTNVLDVNRQLKVQSKSLGGCRSILLNFATEIGLSKTHKRLLTQSKKPNNYKILQGLVRTSKAGNYSPFYLLQTLNKHADTLQKKFTA